MKKKEVVVAKAKKTKKVVKKAAKPAKKATAVKKKAAPAKKAAVKSAKKPAAKSMKKSSAKPVATPKKTASAAKKATPKAVVAQKKSKPNSTTSVSNLVSPLDDRILVRFTAQERMTAGGLYLPETAELSGNLKGDVVAVGRGHLDTKGRLRPVELKIGDRVLFTQHAGAKVTLMGEELLILRESEVLGVLET